MSPCPLCNSQNSTHYLSLKDYFLSQEEFEIVRCNDCGLLYTNPRPEASKLQTYYDSKEYFSHQENSSGLIPRIYEFVKSFNLKRKLKIATTGKSVGKILDIGCGTGDFLLKAKQNNWEVSALEPNDHAREIASKRLNVPIIRPEEISGLPDSSFDVITMWHVLEHVEGLQEEARQLNRLLKPNGRLVIAVPNYQSYDALYYKDKWAAWDVPRHLSHFDKSSMTKVFTPYNDMKLCDVTSLRWDAYYISFLSEKYLSHSLPLIRGCFRGLISNIKACKSNNYSSLVYIFQKSTQNHTVL